MSKKKKGNTGGTKLPTIKLQSCSGLSGKYSTYSDYTTWK